MPLRKTSVLVVDDDVGMLRMVRWYTVCQNIREFSQLPIIMLTGKSKDEEKVQELDTGAADYITKSFPSKELVARVKTYCIDSFDIATFKTPTHSTGKKAWSLESRTCDSPRCYGRHAIRVSNEQ